MFSIFEDLYNNNNRIYPLCTHSLTLTFECVLENTETKAFLQTQQRQVCGEFSRVPAVTSVTSHSLLIKTY